MDGLKEKVQKRIILGSISEINVNFKGEFPSLKIEFSTFASLRPKSCLGTYHQNVTLIIQVVNPSLKSYDRLKFCVCSWENSDCMSHHCD